MITEAAKLRSMLADHGVPVYRISSTPKEWAVKIQAFRYGIMIRLNPLIEVPTETQILIDRVIRGSGIPAESVFYQP